MYLKHFLYSVLFIALKYKVFLLLFLLIDNYFSYYRLLKYLRRIRDEEADLMKDVPGWEVGTLFGEPVYHTIPEDQYQEPFYDELILHADPDKHVMRTLRRFLL